MRLLLLTCSILLALSLTSSTWSSWVCVVDNDTAPAGSDSRKAVIEQRDLVLEILQGGRVPYRLIADSKLSAQHLNSCKVVLLPANANISPRVIKILTVFVNSGGCLISQADVPGEILALVKVKCTGTIAATKYRPFMAMDLDAAASAGLPAEVLQTAQQVFTLQPYAGALANGRWRQINGAPSPHCALVFSPTGAVLTAPFTQRGDRRSQAALLRALCGRYAADLWSVSVPTQDADFAPLGPWSSLAELRSDLTNRQAQGEDVTRTFSLLETLSAQLKAARAAADGQNSRQIALALAEVERLSSLALWAGYPSPTTELRGIWATNTVPGGWDKGLKKLGAANFNAVFPYVATAGAAWYPSAVLPFVTKNDDLADATTASLKYKVPVHARILALYTMCAPTAFREKLKAEGRLIINRKGDSTSWLCPLNAANRSMIASASIEMVTRYPVAGIQFDYLRYPGEDCCFCPQCKADFQHYVGRHITNIAEEVRAGELRQQFLDWRRSVLTDFTRYVVAAIRTARPECPVSLSAFLNWEDHRNTFGQDWKPWLDEGLFDFVCPMNYTPTAERFTLYCQRQVNWITSQTPLCPGLGVNADGMTYGGPQTLLEQITIARNLGCQGWVIFNYDENFANNYLPYLTLGATSLPAKFPLSKLPD